MVRNFISLRLIAALALLALLPGVVQSQGGGKQAGFLPANVGDFRATGATTSPSLADADSHAYSPEEFAITGRDVREYSAEGGRTYRVEAVRTASTSAAFALLNYSVGAENGRGVGAVEGIGVIGVAEPGRIRFIKGTILVDVREVGGQGQDSGGLRAFVRTFADMLEGQAGEVPVLALHLPEWDRKLGEGVSYAVSLRTLKRAIGDRPVLDAVSFEGGAEAVAARYGDSRLVIIEFTTPQYATDNDASIKERIERLRAEGRPAPSAYGRVGNYSVFVFDAPGESAAEGLLAGVKYEKEVRWLGRNPRAQQIAERYYVNTMTGAIIAAFQTTGLAILLCLGVGGLIGGLIFMRRRSQAASQQVYSDAGGMMRLNLDDAGVTAVPRPELAARGDD